MNKVGIITYQDIADGKGRFLQAYALYIAVNKLGYEAEIIDYYPAKNKDIRKIDLSNKLLRVLKNPNNFSCYVSKIQHNFLLKKYEKEFSFKRKKYESFIKCNIKITDKKYYGNEILETSKFCYDAYVCGSDQIWNPYFQGLDQNYYLGFAPKHMRIAYAPSLGTIQIDENKKKILKGFLEEIPYISVREKSGAKLVSELTGRTVLNVLDPTFLLPQQWWNDFADKDATGFRKPYVLTFLFDNSRYPRKIAKEISDKYGYDIISIPDSFADVFFKCHKEIAIGPERFVNLFKNASFICTQSFHGTVLSLIYNRPFFVFDRETKAYVSGVFSRISDLLKIVNLEERILKSGQIIPSRILELDFIQANNILESKRRESMNYLKNSLENSIEGGKNVRNN